VPLSVGGAGSPSNIMWPGPRPTRTPSFILIHPTVWPQYTNVADKLSVMMYSMYVMMSTWSSTAVLARLLPTSLRCRITASSPICWSTTAECAAPEEYSCRRAFSVAGPSVWSSLPEYLRDPAVSRDTFCKHLKTFLFAVY